MSDTPSPPFTCLWQYPRGNSRSSGWTDTAVVRLEEGCLGDAQNTQGFVWIWLGCAGRLSLNIASNVRLWLRAQRIRVSRGEYRVDYHCSWKCGCIIVCESILWITFHSDLLPFALDIHNETVKTTISHICTHMKIYTFVYSLYVYLSVKRCIQYCVVTGCHINRSQDTIMHIGIVTHCTYILFINTHMDKSRLWSWPEFATPVNQQVHRSLLSFALLPNQ